MIRLALIYGLPVVTATHSFNVTRVLLILEQLSASMDLIVTREYQELQAALQRLQTTSISTSIRAPKRRTKAGFNWLDKWTLEVDPETDQPRGMTITLSDWVYEGIMGERSLLTMHQDYFLLTGGLERALYRIARKHAGNQKGGWTCRVEVLRDKTGSDSKPKEFNRMLRSAASSAAWSAKSTF